MRPTSYLLLFLSMTVLFFCSCAGSPPTQFYLISPLPARQSETNISPQAANVRVDRITIPGYLDRPGIVTRVSDHEIFVADLNQWGESLHGNLTYVIAENLSRLLPYDQFAVFPFKCPGPVDYRVTVEIFQMDGRLKGEVQLRAQWSILHGKDHRILASHKSQIQESVARPTYEALVAAQSRLIEALSREISNSLLAFQ